MDYLKDHRSPITLNRSKYKDGEVLGKLLTKQNGDLNLNELEEQLQKIDFKKPSK